MWQHGADAGNLRRSTRKRRVLVHVDYDSDNSEHEVYRRSHTTRVCIALGIWNHLYFSTEFLGSDAVRLSMCSLGMGWSMESGGLSSPWIRVIPCFAISATRQPNRLTDLDQSGCVDLAHWQVSKHRYTSSHSAKAEPSPEEEGSPEPAATKNTDAAAAPRREGLRPRQGIRPPRLELSSQDYEDDDQNSSDREMGMKGNTGNHRKYVRRWPLGSLGNVAILKWNWR